MKRFPGARIEIAHLVTGLSTGGSEMALSRLLAGIDRDRFRNTVISLGDLGAQGPRLQDQGFEIHSLGMNPGYPSPLGLWRLVRQLRRARPQILQTWLYRSDLLGLLAAPFVRRPKLAWNIRCAEMDGRYKRGVRGAMVRVLAAMSGRPDVVVVNSQAGKLFHESLGYRPRRWALIPNGVDAAQFRPDATARASVRNELGLAGEAIIIGLVARYDPVKDHETFLKAAARFLADGEVADFVLIGANVDDSNTNLSDMICAHGLGGKIHLLGERQDVARLTASFDIATCSSISEGFPNVVCEAMACGVPCVSTDVGDVRMFLSDTGVTVAPRDPDGLATAWKELIQAGADGRQALGLAARERATQHYDLGKVVAAYEALYSELAATSPGALV
jgi:glycosyltransferase involved in cell wall biosynthesis